MKWENRPKGQMWFSGRSGDRQHIYDHDETLRFGVGVIALCGYQGEAWDHPWDDDAFAEIDAMGNPQAKRTPCRDCVKALGNVDDAIPAGSHQVHSTA